jgi:type 1 glutamine amidotransferase
MRARIAWCVGVVVALMALCVARADEPRFRVVAMAEHGGVHAPYVAAARKWLNQLAVDQNFAIDYIENAEKIDDEFLSHYQLFIQLNYPPYNWPAPAKAAFEKAITQGTIGWVGFHHASLLGEFDGFAMWPWFHDFMGGIRWKNYIATFAAATVNVEDKSHPIMSGVPGAFPIKLEEWYTWEQSPRANVRVIASVDESTYSPDSKIKMGDHPVIWSNEKVAARNVYIFMGHSPVLFESDEYTKIFRNAIFWAANKEEIGRFKVLAFYSTKVEKDHVAFANDALKFYSALAEKNHYVFDATTDWSKLNEKTLANYDVIVWLNDSPHSPEQRAAFENYMTHGGAWLGCHVAGYNDKFTKWPWFVDFLGGAVFYENNWPPMPAKVIVDTTDHPATKRLPKQYLSPANEFYRWIPSPRLDKDIEVLVTLDPAQYPFGKKDFIHEGDTPVVWTNKKYRMLYVNMGHGDKVLSDETQNKLYEDAIEWLGDKKIAGN